MERYYFDASATYPMRACAYQAMRPWFQGITGNSSSLHAYGQTAKNALEQYRRITSELIGCYPDEIVFTSGGTESCQLAIHGAVAAMEAESQHVAASIAEHPAVNKTAKAGDFWTYHPLAVTSTAAPVLVPSTMPSGGLLCVMEANNEVGTISDLAYARDIARQNNMRLFVDAVQTMGHLPMDVNTSGIDIMAASAHKFGGPIGVGFLYIRRGTPFRSPSTGGGQEAGRRSGTVNVPGIAGMTAALADALHDRTAKNDRLISMRHTLSKLLSEISEVKLTGDLNQRLPGHVSCVVNGVQADIALAALDGVGICAGSGSACSSGQGNPSAVHLAMGLSASQASGALRFSFGEYLTDQQFELALPVISSTLRRLAALR